MLNLHKFNNYAFFCPVSRLHLTVSSPVGFSNEVTPAILKALKAKTVLDVDGVVDIETGTVKAETQAPKKEESVEKTPEPKDIEQKNNNDIEEKTPVQIEQPKEEVLEEVKSEEKLKRSNKKPTPKVEV